MINIKLLFFFIFIILLIFIFTKFKKEITIQHKYTVNSLFNKSKYYIVDTNNNVYLIGNNLFSLQFNKTDKYNLINMNEKYKVYGYGFRIHFLNMYPKIYDLKKV